MVTVPVCAPCNNEKSSDDGYLRDMLVIDIDNTGHPVVQALLTGKVARSARSNRSQIARDLRDRSRILPWHTMGGVFMGSFPAVPIDTQRANRIFARITRGLYYRLYRRRFPSDCDFVVRRVDRFRVGQAVQVMKDLGQTTCRRLGENVFGCMHAWAGEDPSVTHWLQWYYNVFITVTTNISKHPELDQVEQSFSVTDQQPGFRHAERRSPHPGLA